MIFNCFTFYLSEHSFATSVPLMSLLKKGYQNSAQDRRVIDNIQRENYYYKRPKYYRKTWYCQI